MCEGKEEVNLKFYNMLYYEIYINYFNGMW